jgi:nucleotide-binding universal stress UspA family protein
MALLPALVVVALAGNAPAGASEQTATPVDKRLLDLLVLSQVVLSFQLPFAIVPLIHFTSDRRRMGPFVNGSWLKALAWSCAVIVVGLNAVLIYLQIDKWAEAAGAAGWNPWWVYIPAGSLAAALAVFLGWVAVYPHWIHREEVYRAVHTPLLPIVHYGRIGVAVELEGSDDAVLIQGMALARAHGARLVVMHVVEGLGAAYYGPETDNQESRSDRTRLADLVDQLQRDGLQADGVLGYGKPAEELVRLALEQKLDLLVLGTHGHRFFADLALGQTVAPVLHRLRIPVLVVPNRPTVPLPGERFALSIAVGPHGLLAGIGRQGPVRRWIDRLKDEAHTAVAEEEIAAFGVPAAEAADVVAESVVVAEGVHAVDGRRARLAVHRLITWVGVQAVLRRDSEYRAVPRVRIISHAGGAPRLFQGHRLPIVEGRLAGVLEIARQVRRGSAGGLAHGEGRAGAVGVRDVFETHAQAHFRRSPDVEDAANRHRPPAPVAVHAAVGPLAEGVVTGRRPGRQRHVPLSRDRLQVEPSRVAVARTVEQLDADGDGPIIVHGKPRRLEIVTVRDVGLFDVGQQVRVARRLGVADVEPGRDHARRQCVMDVVEAVQGEAHLLEIVLALEADGRLAHPLHGRQQQPDQGRDDADDHEQLDQGHSGALPGVGRGDTLRKHEATS